MKRIFSIFSLVILLASVTEAEVRWPASARTLDEISDLLGVMAALAPNSRMGGETLLSPNELQDFYRARGFAPAWIDVNGVTVQTADVLERLKRSWLEGLDPDRYHIHAVESLIADADDAVDLALLDLLLSDAFISYAREVREGRVRPRDVDPNWRILPGTFAYAQALQTAIAANDAAGALDAMPPTHEGYRRLRLALAHYRAVESRGGWPNIPRSKTKLEKNVRDERVPLLRTRFVMAGMMRDDRVADPLVFDDALEKSVRHFQRVHGLEPDGVVGEGTRAALNVSVQDRMRSIVLNMERWRWLPRTLPSRHVAVNMAGYELVLYDEGLPVREMRVIVGRDQRQTPALATEITSVTVNPYWYVPETVLKEDLLPALARDPAILQRMRLKVFKDLRGGGTEVSADAVDWASFSSKPFPYTLRQEPGAENALGRYKFVLADTPAIYLHDTPNHGLFSRRTLTLSSGCIRVKEPVELAAFLLGNKWDEKQFKEAVASERPHHVKLPEPVPVYLLYFTSWVNELNELHFREDIYSRDVRLQSLIALANKRKVRVPR